MNDALGVFIGVIIGSLLTNLTYYIEGKRNENKKR